jgi:hypothetical protein
VGCPPTEPKSESEKADPVVILAVRLVGVEKAVLGEPMDVRDDVVS